MLAKLFIAAISLSALLARADPDPIVPGPGNSYKQGGNCMIGWDADTTGLWTDMLIELKTGDNYNMVPLKTITTVDATKQTQFAYPCPDVSPNSAIYFYEFSCSSSTEKYWTTRFVITDADGNSTPPTETTQPNGDKVPWGTGTLISDGGSLNISSSGLSSVPSSSSSSLPGGGGGGGSSSSSRLLSSSRSSSTGTPAPTQTGVNTSSSQSNSNGDTAVAIPKAFVFIVGLVAASTAFL